MDWTGTLGDRSEFARERSVEQDRPPDRPLALCTYLKKSLESQLSILVVKQAALCFFENTHLVYGITTTLEPHSLFATSLTTHSQPPMIKQANSIYACIFLTEISYSNVHSAVTYEKSPMSQDASMQVRTSIESRRGRTPWLSKLTRLGSDIK